MRLGTFLSARLLVELRGIRRALERSNQLQEAALRASVPGSRTGFFSSLPIIGEKRERGKAPKTPEGWIPDDDSYYADLEKKAADFQQTYGRDPEDEEDLEKMLEDE